MTPPERSVEEIAGAIKVKVGLNDIQEANIIDALEAERQKREEVKNKYELLFQMFENQTEIGDTVIYKSKTYTLTSIK